MTRGEERLRGVIHTLQKSFIVLIRTHLSEKGRSVLLLFLFYVVRNDPDLER